MTALLLIRLQTSLTYNGYVCSGANWLATSFFLNYADAVAHPEIAVTSPADTAFLTQADVDLLDWGQQPWQGEAWKQSVQTALKEITLEDYYKLIMQRFPRAIASVGVYEAGTQHGLHCIDIWMMSPQSVLLPHVH